MSVPRKSRNEYAKIAAETLQILDKGTYKTTSGQLVNIYDKLDYCMSNTILHKPNYRSTKLPPNPKYDTKIEVVLETTLSGCKRLKDYSTVALNFASAKNPGGGFLTGAVAQEESLARASGLYLCISDTYDGSVSVEMYEHNRTNPHNGIYSDYMLYSPKVPIFRDDNDQLLTENEVYCTSFITSPAVNAKNATERGVKYDSVLNAMGHRINLILNTAVRNNHDAIVLGAFGCGVFGNTSIDIAEIFYDYLKGDYDGYFKRVVFSILGNNEYQEFKKLFKN